MRYPFSLCLVFLPCEANAHRNIELLLPETLTFVLTPSPHGGWKLAEGLAVYAYSVFAYWLIEAVRTRRNCEHIGCISLSEELGPEND